MNHTVTTTRCGETHAQRYELVPLQTTSVYGSGRPAWGVKFQSASDRRLISDEIVWFETSEQERDAFIAGVVAGTVRVGARN